MPDYNTKRKHLSQKSQDEANRSLELAVTEAEKVIEQRRNECDNAREGHNAESKFLINLRGDLSAAKIELLTYTSQIKSMRDDVSRADDFVRKENSNRQAVDSERQHIETDIAAFHDKISRMNLTRNNNEGLIIQLGLEIDGVDQEREVLRKNYKTTTNKKDIASALLVAIKVEHNKVCRTVENMAGEMRGTMSRFHQLEESLESTKAMTIRLSDEKKRIQELIERKGKHNNDLVSLENDLAKQLFKNSALLVEIGRPINLHRWRFLREKAPQKFSTLESICNRQRQASQLTHRQASQEKAIERSEVALTKLRETISCHQSVDDMKSHLYGLKSEVNAMDTEIKVCEKELQERIVRAANLNKMIVSLEKKVVDMKTHYIVSVVENDNEYKD
jgi:chromosome segregation ATPase